MRHLVIGLALTGLTSLFLGGCLPYNQDSQKIGTIFRVSDHSGFFCGVPEAEIIRGGFSNGSGAMGTAFDFTVPAELLPTLRGYMDAGTEVKITYHSNWITFCYDELLDKVEPLHPK